MKLIFLLLPFLFSCGSFEADTSAPEMSTETFYKRDMIISASGETFEGVAVLPKQDKYDFHVEARGDLDLFMMSTCTKRENKEKAWNVKKKVRSGLFGWGSKKIDLKREVTFTYIPNELEKNGDCPMQLIGIEEKGGRNSFGFVDFESDTYKLPARLLCNGNDRQVGGTSVCQSGKGLVQKIVFDRLVVPEKNNDCGISPVESKEFIFTLKKGQCKVRFISLEGEEVFHGATFMGFEGVLIRSVE